MKRAPYPLARPDDSFSLIEVVLALGIVSFAIIAILGLFSAGLKANKESYDQIQEANIASLLISTRRASPTATSSNFSSFALPRLDVPASNSVPAQVGLDGSTINSPLYNMFYIISTNDVSGSKVANVYLLIWGPLAAANPQTNNPGSYYEISTQIALP